MADFKEWVLVRLPAVSTKLRPLVEQLSREPVWGTLLSRPVSELATRRAAWNELGRVLGNAQPPSYDPVRVWEWAQERLWQVCVFTDEGACDLDQFDLEVWWSEESRRAALVCGLGHRFRFQRRGFFGDASRLSPWDEADGPLLPAPRSVVRELLPDADLV